MSTPPSASGPAAVPSRLRRLRDDRWVAGVCSGIARELGVDPLVVRIATIVLSLVGGAGLLLYVLGVLLIPGEGEQDSLVRRAIDGEDRVLVAGLVLLALVLWAVATDGWFIGFGFGDGWGFGTLLLGGVLIWWLMGRQDRKRESDGPDAPAAAPADPDAPTAVFGEPAAPRPRSSARIALGITLAGVAIVGAIGGLAGDEVRWDVVLAAMIIGLGAAIVIAAPFGGARALIPLGLVLASGAGIAAAADLELEGGAGERVYRPVVWSDLKSDYHLAAGRQELDLRQLALPDGRTKVKLEQGFGELVVRVPERSRVIVDAHVSGGEVEVLGRESNGFDADVDVRGVGNGPIVEIDADLGFGYIGIVRGDDPLGHGRRRDFGPGAIVLGGVR
ncbi:MAG TPA: PspC domain-containing protein [Solirubrobacteraceae bacterium]